MKKHPESNKISVSNNGKKCNATHTEAERFTNFIFIVSINTLPNEKLCFVMVILDYYMYYFVPYLSRFFVV